MRRRIFSAMLTLTLAAAAEPAAGRVAWFTAARLGRPAGRDATEFRTFEPPAVRVAKPGLQVISLRAPQPTAKNLRVA
ncbi:MAG: hypothetical protein RLZZ522_62 [Verrucomicrobiota bacterium]|jgi:hypothetical protein